MRFRAPSASPFGQKDTRRDKVGILQVWCSCGMSPWTSVLRSRRLGRCSPFHVVTALLAGASLLYMLRPPPSTVGDAVQADSSPFAEFNPLTAVPSPFAEFNPFYHRPVPTAGTLASAHHQLTLCGPSADLLSFTPWVKSTMPGDVTLLIYGAPTPSVMCW